MSDSTSQPIPPAGDAAAPEVNLERKARKEAQKALKAQQAAQKKAAKSAAAAASSPTPSASSSQPKANANKPARRPQSSTEQLSRSLAYILRHGAEKEGLAIRPDGYIKLDDVLNRPRVKSVNMAEEEGGKRRPALEDVQNVVEGNDKKRFELTQEGEEWLVRAVQGHSLKSVSELDNVELTLDNYRKVLSTTDVEEDELAGELDSKLGLGQGEGEGLVEVIHGTNSSAWEEILASGGLKPMTRNHIHLAKGKFGEKGVISGMRKTANRLVFVDINKALHDGIRFQVSSNRVVLTEGKEGMLGKEYFTKVEDSKGNIIWQP